LRPFVPASQKNDQRSPPLLEIHPVTGAVVDAQLRNAFAHWLNISRVPKREAFNPRLNARPRPKVAQAIEPLSEHFSFSNFNQLGRVYPKGYNISKRFSP
jgi:hypothetical protein